MTDQIWVRYVQNLTFQVYRVKNLTFYSKVSNFTAKPHFFQSIRSKTSLLGVWGVILGGLRSKTSGSFAGSVRVGFRGGGGGYPRSNDNFVIFGPKSVLFGVIFPVRYVQKHDF